MAKLLVDIGGSEYKFELDRETLVWGERNGFDITKSESQPNLMITLFWIIGLKKNYPQLNIDYCSKLLTKYTDENGDVAEVIKFLGEEYETFFKATQVSSNDKKKAKRE